MCMMADFPLIANSKMPTKKRSCFQITSVIQAQAAGNSVIDDTDNYDDPDESRTEDASSETLDVSRTDLGLCDRSSSEEALDHTEDDHNGLAPVNGLPCVKGAGTGGRNTPINLGGSLPVPAASLPIVPIPSSVPSSGAPASCSSRFRVIKLDHSTGEPFRRGRWACTEFYEKDSDSNKTADSIKATVNYDHSIARDNGVGPITNSVTTPRALNAHSVETTDSGYQKGLPVPLLSSEARQQSYTLTPQIGSMTSAFQPTGYATAKTQQAHEKIQHVGSLTFPSNSLNGFHPGAMLQETPTVMPSATQPQPLVYSNGMSPGQPEYYPQHFGSNTQSLPTSQPMVPSSNHPPVSTATGPAGQSLQTQGAEAALTQGLHPQTASARPLTPVSQTSGRMGITVSSPITIMSDTSIQSVPATVASNNTAQGHSSASLGQAQDTRPKTDALPLSISCVMPGKAAAAVSLFGISIPMDGDDDSASGASVVAIDNKIEQAMDLVKNHLMYAVREEVEVLKEQIKELYERNSVLERENAVLKSLANTEQLSKLSNQLKQVNNVALPQLQQQQFMPTNNNSLGRFEVVKSAPHQPNITTA